jgi:hypothetical protein
MGIKIEGLLFIFNRPKNVEDLRQRIRPVIIERSVQSVGEC